MINYPFVIISDVHCHDFSAFSYTREDEINSRLWDIMEAIREAVAAIKKAGGKDLVITGDLFHTRGRIKPSVFNPVHWLFREICGNGFKVWAIAGNHDLEGKESHSIGNILNSFNAIPGFTSINTLEEHDNGFVFLPWVEHKDEFIKIVNSIKNPEGKVLFCHIGIDGVLDKVAGKVGKAVFERGFKYVFAGDYHEHKALGNGIYSVGALTHHSFGDVGTTAGYLLVTAEGVTQHETKAPKFVMGGNKRDYSGNYVRITGCMTEEQAKYEIKKGYDYGAKFVQDLSTRPTIKDTSASTAPVRVDLNLETALKTYAERRYGKNAPAVLEEALRLKNEHV